MKNLFTLITVYIIAFAGFTSISWLFPVIPYYTHSLGLNVSDTGLIVSIYSYVIAVGIIPVGIISDRWGRRTFLVTGLIISTAAPFLYPLAHDAAMLYIIRIVHGLGSALFIPTALALVTDLTPDGEHGKAIGWYTASSQLGFIAGPLAGGFLLEHFGFTIAFYGCSLVPLVALIFVFTRLHALPHTPLHSVQTDIHPFRWLASRGAVISIASLALVAAGSAAISTFIPLYTSQFNISEAGAGMIITACYVSSTAMRIPAGNMSDKFGSIPIILIGMTLCASGIALIPAFHDILQLAGIGLIFGLGMGLAMPAALTQLAKISPSYKRGFSMGMGTASFQVGMALGSTVLGMIAYCSGYTAMYLATGAAIGACTLMILILYKTGRGKQT